MTDFTAAIADLPFVSSDLGGAVDLWVVKPSGDYATDCRTGRRHASDLISVIDRYDAPNFYGEVVKRISQKDGDWSGIETGFFQEVAERLI